MDISCIVLAGGKGLRLGHDKVSKIIGSKSLLQRVVCRLSALNSVTIIVTAQKQSIPEIINYPKLKIVSDIYPDKGPLGGIYTGLAVSDSFYSLVVASDMPFLNKPLLHYLVQLAPDFDLVVPRLGNRVEPLHAVYSKSCLAPIENLLRQNNLTTSRLLSLVKVRYVETEEIDRYDPDHLSFFNINTEADLKLARELASNEKNNDKC